MSDSWPSLDEEAPKPTNVVELTVSELSNALKRSVEDQFGHVRLRGELSGVSRPASGHIYMALKDDKAVLDAVCWRGVAGRLSFAPEDGVEVIVTGKLTTYPARSKYQLVVDHMEPAGEGALMALLEKRKKQLAAEGLFAPERKKQLPFLPRTIGVITSPTGAVVRDILHRLNDRFPRHVMVWPVIVQGKGAAEQVAAAIEGFNKMDGTGPSPRPDLLIVARGGGSIEDLWAFNEEVVVRAAAASDIPLISSVGHETDTTLIDYASDHRAPTPTAAAERAVPVRAELQATVLDLDARLERRKGRMISDRRERLTALSRGLPSPRDMMGLSQQRLDDASARLPRALMSVSQKQSINLGRVVGKLSLPRLKQALSQKSREPRELSRRLTHALSVKKSHLEQKFTATTRMLDSLSFERVLDRGYAMVMDASGSPVTEAQALSTGDAVTTRFKDGEKAMRVEEDGVIPNKPTPKIAKKVAKKSPKKTPKKASKSGNKDTRQGDLF